MLLIGCRGCGALLAQAATVVAADRWNEREMLTERRGPILPVGSVMEWTEGMWTSDNRWLPFPTGSWLLAPATLTVPPSEAGTFGCCGFSPTKSDSGYSKNQFCTCIAAIGWIDTDCLSADYVALDPASVDVARE